MSASGERTLPPRAQRLLDAHVAHDVAQLRGGAFATLVEHEVDHALASAARLTLDAVVGRQQVKDVAHKYVSTFRLPGAIPEIAGELATRLRAHPANGAPLGDVLPRRHVLAAVLKGAELRDVRRSVVDTIAASPSMQTWLADYLRSLLVAPVERTPLGGLARAVTARLPVDELDQRGRELAEWLSARLLEQWAARTTQLSDDELADALLEVYDANSDRAVGDLLGALADDDVVDLLVIGYELWLDLRTGDYLRALIDTGVDYFFDRYGDTPLDALLAEFGLGRADLVEEAMRFAPMAIEALHEAGVLGDLVRRRLLSFYASPEATAILDDPAD
ncbi:MAG: hypothetical protein ACTHMS_09595 [Jatrophihabitans sp.]|uniref:hypothetical protein n=1 Tax=Jatrophihabitans sp. TaxID=1932789 RepID=UPI003F81BF83